MKRKVKSSIDDLDKHMLNILYDIILPEPFMLFHVTYDWDLVM